MKKLLMFVLSLGLAVALFLSVAAVSITLSLYSRSDSSETESTPNINTVDSPENGLKLYNVAVILKTEENVYAADVTFNRSGYVEAKKMTVSQDVNGLSETELLKSAGIDKSLQKYIIFDQKIFVETTDRCGGLVYNDGVKGEVLLTGAQSIEKLDPNVFCNFCEQLAKKAFKDKAMSTFLFLVDNTSHNITFPEIYEMLNSK